MYKTYNSRPFRHASPGQRRSRPAVRLAIIIAILLVGYIGYALLRTLPPARLVFTPPVTPSLIKVNIPWPKSKPTEQAAYGADGYGLLAASNTAETPASIASVTKVITAMAVLEKKPLKPGEAGPAITLTAADVALYNKYVAKEGSVVPVAAGQTITEYQALQALLLPSANNIADTLVYWAFGGMPAYTTYANAYVNKLGMHATNVTDASGFAPKTISTASDLVKLGDTALDNPVFAEIVKQTSAEFPGYGTIRNTNRLLGQSGITGIKTGETNEAGGCFLGVAEVPVGNQKIRVITAVMGAPDLASAMRDTLPLIQSTPSQFQTQHVVRAGQPVGTASTLWGSKSVITATKNITAITWTGLSAPAPKPTTDFAVPAAPGTDIGDISLDFQGTKQSAGLKLASAIDAPSLWWRLRHPW